MIIIKLKGGLGNQMFQYAYGRKLELSGKKVVFDTSFFKGNKAKKDAAREFKLNKFNLQTQSSFSDKKHVFLDIFNKIKRNLGFKIKEFYQGEKYFIAVGELIRREFTLKKELSFRAQEILQKIEKDNSISLHIRRGDYVTNLKTSAYHGVYGLDYYRAAMKLIKEKISNPIFFIFSDDINWAKENFAGEEFIFVSSPEIEDVEEMILMSKCKHNIIANSSFSWWGAWLNNNLEKVIIAPKKWFNDKKVAQSEIIPSIWIKI